MQYALNIFKHSIIFKSRNNLFQYMSILQNAFETKWGSVSV